MKHENMTNLHHALVQSWQIDSTTGLTHHAFLDALADRVAAMLKHNLDRLASAMYTLDVDEARFNAALALPGNDATARAVAELILEREIQKMVSRQKYREPVGAEEDVPTIEIRPKDDSPED